MRYIMVDAPDLICTSMAGTVMAVGTAISPKAVAVDEGSAMVDTATANAQMLKNMM